MSFHERLDDREHRGRLRLVALERADHQGKAGGVGEQADGDLRLQAAFLGEPRLAESVPGIGLEIQRGDVVKDQAGRAQPGMRRARRWASLTRGKALRRFHSRGLAASRSCTLAAVTSTVFQQAKADHDFNEQELELNTNTPLTREIDRLTGEVHRPVVGNSAGSGRGTS